MEKCAEVGTWVEEDGERWSTVTRAGGDGGSRCCWLATRAATGC
jgi:hypothetical protein